MKGVTTIMACVKLYGHAGPLIKSLSMPVSNWFADASTPIHLAQTVISKAGYVIPLQNPGYTITAQRVSAPNSGEEKMEVTIRSITKTADEAISKAQWFPTHPH